MINLVHNPIWVRTAVLTLLLTCIAVLLRINNIEDMEYKSDERIVYKVSREIIQGIRLSGEDQKILAVPVPVVGINSSIGLPNPPGLLYLTTVITAVAKTPVGLASFIAIINSAAIVFLALFLRRYLNEFIVWSAAFLMATNPWSIIFSRKIWAQDLIAPFAILLLFACCQFFMDHRKQNWFWIAIAFSFLLQLHFSALSLPFFLLCLMVVYRDVFRESGYKPIGYAVLLVFVIFLPYAAVILKNLASALSCAATSYQYADSRPEHILKAVGYLFQVFSAHNFSHIIGSDDALFSEGINGWIIVTNNVVTAVLLLIGIFLMMIKRKEHSFITFYFSLFLLFQFGYISFASSRVYPSYFLICYPIGFVLVGFALNWIPGKLVKSIAATLLVSVNIFITLSLQNFIHENKGADIYGVPYSMQTDAMRDGFKSVETKTVDRQ